MSMYRELDIKLLKMCEMFQSTPNDQLGALCLQFNDAGSQILSLEDKELKDVIDSIYPTFDTFWYFLGMDQKESEEGYEEIRKEVGRYIAKVKQMLSYVDRAKQ